MEEIREKATRTLDKLFELSSKLRSYGDDLAEYGRLLGKELYHNTSKAFLEVELDARSERAFRDLSLSPSPVCRETNDVIESLKIDCYDGNCYIYIKGRRRSIDIDILKPTPLMILKATCNISEEDLDALKKLVEEKHRELLESINLVKSIIAYAKLMTS